MTVTPGSTSEEAARDIGLRAVEAVRLALMVEDQWVLPGNRGFAWWASDIRQDVEAGAPWMGFGEPLARLTIRTTILSLHVGVTPDVHTAVSQMNSASTGGAYRIDGDTIVHELGVVLGLDGLAWVPRAAAAFALLALSEGVVVARRFAPRLVASVLRSQHPHAGPRGEPDALLDLPAWLADNAQGGAGWEDARQFVEAAQVIQSALGYSLDDGTDRGLVAEFGFGQAESSFLLVQATDSGRSSIHTLPAVEPDARLGHGLLVWLLLPRPGASVDSMALAAAQLNEAELGDVSAREHGGPMHFGAWTTWRSDRGYLVGYRMFIPAALSGHFPIQNVAVHMASRASFASRLLVPEEETIDASALTDWRMRQIQAHAEGRDPRLEPPEAK